MGNAEISRSFDMFPDNKIPVINPAAGDLVIPATILPPGKPRVIHLRSLEELRAAASDWDDLWRRSEVTFPTMRAELLAQWLEHFAADAEFHAIAVQQDGRWVAALPIVRRRIGRIIPAGVLPCNQWSSSGECMLDFSIDVKQVSQLLLDALRECNLPLLWLDEAILETARWQVFMRAVADNHLKNVVRPRWQVGRVRIDGDWQACQARWSRKHRQHMAWLARQLARQGEVRLVLLSQLAPDEAAMWMRRALEIENLGWKGRSGGSVVSVPGMSEFFIRQARQLAAWGQLELAFLHCGGRPIAFCYGQIAKGVFHSAKVGYDPRYARFSPGQLLRYFLLERFYAEPGRAAIDFLGPMTESHAHWRPDTYTVARFAVALSPLGRMALWAYEMKG
ncbi:MAG: GNAT family N-acetyltransferase [Thermoguttaceae bacterium]|jgi:CelD/BcsL family acetyltransferase involved in cellulose biosynthesis